MNVQAFFDNDTFTVTYVAYDPATRDAVVIDPVLALDTARWRTSNKLVEDVARFVRESSLAVRWVLDTHAHADHLSGIDVAKQLFGAPTAVGEGIDAIQRLFAPVFEMDVPTDGSQWDMLAADGQVLEAGSLSVETIHTPGHTPACVTWKIGDAIFTGDLLFTPDYGTGRTDFPSGSAEAMFDSVNRLYQLPDTTRVFVGHDYLPGGRALAYESSIGEQKRSNIRLNARTNRADFVTARQARDAELAPPRLILPALQVNIDAGKMPAPGPSGRSSFRIPTNFLGS